MEVLFYRYNSICEIAYINALRAYGIDVIEDTTQITNKSLSATDMLYDVEKQLKSHSFMFVISINYFPVLSSVCNIYHIPYVSVVVDSPLWTLYSNTIKNEYNRVFIFDRAQYERHVIDNPECVFHMPLFADIPYFDEFLKNNANNKRYLSDVSFIGSLYTEKCPYNELNDLPTYLKGFFEGIMESQLKIYGYNFIYDIITSEIIKEFKKHAAIQIGAEDYRNDDRAVIAYEYLGIKVSEMERIRLLKEISECNKLDIYTGSDTSFMPKANNRGFAKSLTEMPLIFRDSKINLQITAKTIETGLSQRVWDVLSCGGFLIMNYQNEISDYFSVGENIEVYSSREELLDKISYYMSHDNERIKIANNGYELVHKYHTPEKRLGEIFKKILK